MILRPSPRRSRSTSIAPQPNEHSTNPTTTIRRLPRVPGARRSEPTNGRLEHRPGAGDARLGLDLRLGLDRRSGAAAVDEPVLPEPLRRRADRSPSGSSKTRSRPRASPGRSTGAPTAPRFTARSVRGLVRGHRSRNRAADRRRVAARRRECQASLRRSISARLAARCRTPNTPAEGRRERRLGRDRDRDERRQPRDHRRAHRPERLRRGARGRRVVLREDETDRSNRGRRSAVGPDASADDGESGDRSRVEAARLAHRPARRQPTRRSVWPRATHGPRSKGCPPGPTGKPPRQATRTTRCWPGSWRPSKRPPLCSAHAASKAAQIEPVVVEPAPAPRAVDRESWISLAMRQRYSWPPLEGHRVRRPPRGDRAGRNGLYSVCQIQSRLLPSVRASAIRRSLRPKHPRRGQRTLSRRRSPREACGEGGPARRGLQ